VVLLCGLVEFFVVYAHPPSRDGTLWNHLVLTVFHYRHASFLGHDLDRAHPLTVRDRIYDPGVQELEDLFLHHLSHGIVQPSLGFPRRCHVWIERDMVCAKSRADALEILESVPKNRSMLL